jgi:hypothetical protein
MQHLLKLGKSLHCKIIAAEAKSAYAALAYGCDDGIRAETVPCEYIADVYLDNRYLYGCDSVADSVAVVCIGTCIEDDTVKGVPCGVELVYNGSFARSIILLLRASMVRFP